MGNLGYYQDITKLIKALGGPKVAIPVILGSGYAVIRIGEAGVKKAYKVSRTVIRNWTATDSIVGRVFTVHSDSDDSGGGLTLREGDEIQVLERHGEAVQIVVLGNADNPYFASAALLASISDFPDDSEVGAE